MSRGLTIRAGRPISGSGQTLALTSGTAAPFAAAMGGETNAFKFRFGFAATPFMGFVRVSGSGAAAAANKDYPICSNDPPIDISCAPGDQVSVFQSSGGAQTAYLCELTA